MYSKNVVLVTVLNYEGALVTQNLLQAPKDRKSSRPIDPLFERRLSQ
jgi:hypothetical protein